MTYHRMLIWFCCLLVAGHGKRTHRIKRSAEFPTLKGIADNKPGNVRIQNSDCSFSLVEDKCLRKYTGSGTCTFSQILSQFVPDVDLEDATNNFIVPSKFLISKFDVSKCQEQDGVVSFRGRSVESVELVPQHLALGGETELEVSWNFLEVFNPANLEVKLKGLTSVGSNTQIELKVEKSADGSDYVLQFKPGTLNVNNFLAKFGVDASQMISSDLSFANSRMGLATLILQEPQVDGLFSPGGGFEIVATGKISAPEFPADASKFYVIVQDFKEGTSDSANEGYGKPIAAIFALYNEKIRNAITSLTGINAPNIALFKGVDEVAVTVATKPIFNINSKALRDSVEKYVPIEGLDMISQGLTVMHYSPNKNDDIKDKDHNTASLVLYRCEITRDKLTWTSPQRIETDVRRFGGSVWSFQGCKDSLAIPADTKGILIDISYKRQKNQMEVRFNLTQRVPVLPNGLISLFNSTIILFSREKIEDGCSWEMTGGGQEAILDELVDVSITQARSRTTVSAMAEIFDMETLMNRTNSKPFDDEYEKAFHFVTHCPLEGLRYEAIFFKGNVLRFKGSALVEGKPHVEIIYFIANDQPQLKIGFQFRAQELHKVVHLFYGEQKVSSTWIKFYEICVVVKEKDLVKNVHFDRECMRKADESFDTTGIGFIADNLILRNCKTEDWVMCKFLRLHKDRMIELAYFGKMLPEKVIMTAQGDERFELGNGIVFQSRFLVSHLTASHGDDRFDFTARVVLTHTNDIFEGSRIFYDGSNHVMLSFQSEPDSYQGMHLLNVPYARMRPIRSRFGLPSTEKLDTIEFRSPLHIGTVESDRILVHGATTRQYISYPDDGGDPVVKFVGERSLLKLNKIYHAFGQPFRVEILKKAAFRDSVVFAYTSTDEEWDLPEFQVKVRKGLHLFGKLQLKTHETYDTTVHLLDNMQIQTVIHLRPLRFGEITHSKHGKPSYKNINLILYRSKDQPEAGPEMVADQQSQYLRGYAETVGLEGAFVSEPMKRDGSKEIYTINLRGNLYKEVENVEIKLTTEDEERPKDFKFKYFVDITHQTRKNINSKLREVLVDLEKNAEKGRESAKEVANDVEEILDSYKRQQKGYLDEMDSIQQQIMNINNGVDLSMIDITTDCIDECKTVFIPKIEWEEDCIQGSGGQRNMKCMTWRADREKVINVLCLLRCEAKKMAAAGKAGDMLEEIRFLVNRYRENKVLYENVGKLIAVMKEANEIAKSAQELVESKTDIQDELNELLAILGDLVEINSLKVDTELESISPPCLPFQFDFTLKTTQQTSHNGVQRICFNGEFYKNVGVLIMRTKYPAVNEMYKALEEAELRYARIEAIRNNLVLVEEKFKSSKRGSIPSEAEEDPVERMLTKMSKRRIPTFTVKGDRTVLAFHHYSPWATIKRSNPFEVDLVPSHRMKYNTSSIQGKSACHQTKEIIAQYKDIADNLQQLSSSYKHGRHLYDQSQSTIVKDLANSLHDINEFVNTTQLSYYEKRDMYYWYQYTERGMGQYLDAFKKNLETQGEQSVVYLRNELSSFYGMTNFLGHLDTLGSKAIARSHIHRGKRKKHMMVMSYIAKELQNLFYGTVKLERASSVIRKVKDDIQSLYHTSVSCY